MTLKRGIRMKKRSQPPTVAKDGKITCPNCKFSWYFAPDELLKASREHEPRGRLLGLKDLPELARLARMRDR